MPSRGNEIPSNSVPGKTTWILSRFFSASAILISILQSVFFLAQWPGEVRGMAAICLAAVSLLLSLNLFRRHDVRLAVLLLILYCGQLGIFAAEFIDAVPFFPLRILQVAIWTSYLATAMAALLAFTRIISPANAILVSLSVWTGVFISETALELLSPQTDARSAVSVPEWSGGMLSDPVLGLVYAPNSTVKTYYPDNPRGYFTEEDARLSRWRFQVLAGNVAELVLPPNNLDAIRVAIRKYGTQDTWGIQLNQDRFTVKAHHRYSVTFRARADSPRNVIVSFSQAHEPWTNLGLWKNIVLTREWKSFEEEFTSDTDENNARIHFDVGSSDVSVEFSHVNLLWLPGGISVAPDLPRTKYVVSYRFNGLGCRGHDIPIPRTMRTARILLLGDSFTQGVGVHEEHTFAKQLERLLNEDLDMKDSLGNYEVINCGVSGFSTNQERLFYQLVASQYKPDVVLLVMVWNDDLSHVEELQRGYANRPRGKLEYLFHLWGQIQEYYHRRPFPDFSKSVEEIHQLNDEVRTQGAGLGIVLFRAECDFAGSTLHGKIWNHLIKSVAEGLHATAIPILDLGNALCDKHSVEDLATHPLDLHPNEIAHEIAAQTIFNYLKTEKLLNPQPDPQEDRQGIASSRE
jgi:hypothetical protein